MYTTSLLNELDDEDLWMTLQKHSGDNDRGNIGSSCSSTSSSLSHIASQLQRLDRNCRCKICRELMTMPTLLMPCGHAFCSECIRTHVHAQKHNLLQRDCTCPVCRVVVMSGKKGDIEKILQPNRPLQEVIAAFTTLRHPLHQTLLQRAVQSAATTTSSVSVPSSLSIEANESVLSERESERARSSERIADKVVVLTRMKLPPRMSSLKIKELRHLCAHYGLSMLGNEGELRHRLDLFSIFWNSRVDTTLGDSHASTTTNDAADGDPTAATATSARNEEENNVKRWTHASLLAEFEKREQALQTAALDARRNGAVHDSKRISNLFEHRNHNNANTTNSIDATGGVSLSSGDAAFDKKFNSNFAALAAQCRKQMGKRKSEEQRSLVETENSSPLCDTTVVPNEEKTQETISPSDCESRLESDSIYNSGAELTSTKDELHADTETPCAQSHQEDDTLSSKCRAALSPNESRCRNSDDDHPPSRKMIKQDADESCKERLLDQKKSTCEALSSSNATDIDSGRSTLRKRKVDRTLTECPNENVQPGSDDDDSDVVCMDNIPSKSSSSHAKVALSCRRRNRSQFRSSHSSNGICNYLPSKEKTQSIDTNNGSLNDQWRCPRCTVYNRTRFKICQVCDLARQSKVYLELLDVAKHDGRFA